MIQIERLRFRHIWSMMTRSIHNCWQVRTNKCVRTNICKTSVFVFSVKVGLGKGDFCAMSRRLISKIRFRNPISVAVTIYGTRFDLRDSKRRALENKFFMRICCMFLISKCRRLRSKSVHNFGTCVWRTAAQWQNPIFPASKHVFFPEVASALRFSKRKSRSCAQT